MIIYKITNKISGKVYVGQTTQSIVERFWQHCNRSPSQTHRSYVYNAIQKDGKDNFTIEQIASAETIDQLNALEIAYIEELDSIAPNGYNLQEGGNNKTCHEETRAKISNTLKGRPIKNRQNGAEKGRPVSNERKAMISKTMTGVAQPWKYKAVIDSNGVIHESVQSAAKALGVSRATISQLIKTGKTGRLGLSFKFKQK